MCSLIHFIEDQKVFIQRQQKRIQSLTQFLNQFDKQLSKEDINQSNHIENVINANQPNVNSETHKNKVSDVVDDCRVTHSDVRNIDDLMFRPNDELSWLRFSNNDDKRMRLAEERRKEYNEYLREKSNIESERQKRKHVNINGMIAHNYSEILNRKRIEEQKHREINGINDIEMICCEDKPPEDKPPEDKPPEDKPPEDKPPEDKPPEDKPPEDKHLKVAIVGDFHCSNNKFTDEYITPRSRLLATHSSRVRAAKYAEELRQQILEKERIKAEERERIRSEELALERKIESDRLKMLREYESEQKNLLKKTNQILRRQELSEMMNNNDILPSTGSLSVLRSPSYRQSREERAMGSPHKKDYNKAISRLFTSNSEEHHSTASQTENQIICSPEIGPSGDNKYDVNELETIDNQYESTKPSFDSSTNNRVQTSEPKSNGRVASQLSEVRQMMQKDHIQMLEQLKAQQIPLNDVI